jgi:hypothetical protein
MKNKKVATIAGPIWQRCQQKGAGGIDVSTTASLLRRYVVVERGLLRSLAGWFIAARAYEDKYTLAYHLLDHAEHVSLLRARLTEIRGGQINANVDPALVHGMAKLPDATDFTGFLDAAYGVLQADLLRCYRDHRAAADPVANAVEIRLLDRMIPIIEGHQNWAEEKTSPCPEKSEPGQRTRRFLLESGGISGLADPCPQIETLSAPQPPSFERPKTILFDHRIRRGELTAYENRNGTDIGEGTREDFKVFFNELYAAALLASVLYDADPSEVPWEFLQDVARHFWDEVRHSQFGAVRLKELGYEPDTCNPVLYECAQGLPILHRFAYLTFGLETHFMPRKRPRVTKYGQIGDRRSEFFADQDWSDETLHVRFGKRWLDRLLEDDARTVGEILEEVDAHIARVGGKVLQGVVAPF